MKSHQRLFNQTLMGLFMIVFFSYTDTQKVKLVTLFDRRSVPQDDKDDAHTESHIGIGNQNVANSTTALK